MLHGSSGELSVQSSLIAPISGQATVGPASGEFYALTSQRGLGTYALTQAFVIPDLTTATIISFDMFRNDYSDSPIVRVKASLRATFAVVYNRDMYYLLCLNITLILP